MPRLSKADVKWLLRQLPFQFWFIWFWFLVLAIFVTLCAPSDTYIRACAVFYGAFAAITALGVYIMYDYWRIIQAKMKQVLGDAESKL